MGGESTKRRAGKKALNSGKRAKMIAATPSKMKAAAKKKAKLADKQVKIIGEEGQPGKVAKPVKRKARVERLLKAREPQIVEHTKRVLVLKGMKTSEIVRDTLLDINSLTKPNNINFSRKNEILPFEDITSLEFLCDKNQAGLFCLGTHNKKRPDNLVLGRMFDGHLLDMYEFGISQFKSLTQIPGPKKQIGAKPVMIFTGDQWDSDRTYKKISNLLLDFFRADRPDKISLKGIDHVISCSVADGKIYIRGYNQSFLKSGSKVPDVELSPMGPFLDLTLRRSQLPSDDAWKAALKKPPTQQKVVKNMTRNAFGDKIGRLHMKKQNIDQAVQGKRVTALSDKKRNTTDVTEDFGKEKRNTKRHRLA